MCRALCHGRVSRTPPVFLEDLFVYLFIYFKKRGTPDILLDFTWTNSIYSKIFSGHMLLEHHICIRFYSIDFLKRKWTQNLGLVPLSLLAQLSRVLKGCQMADILHDRAQCGLWLANKVTLTSFGIFDDASQNYLECQLALKSDVTIQVIIFNSPLPIYIRTIMHKHTHHTKGMRAVTAALL